MRGRISIDGHFFAGDSGGIGDGHGVGVSKAQFTAERNRTAGPLMDIAVATTRPSTQSTAGFVTDEPRTDFQDITHYNNFYEFALEKESVADLAVQFISRPWQVSVGGLCRKPATFDLDDLLKIAPAEERVYRMRCVEAWSMVIPWDGFSLSKLLDRVQPLGDARFVAFQTLLDPKRLPNQNGGDLPWPYVEGLRMDEAMHPLTILASGYLRQAASGRRTECRFGWWCRGNMGSRGSSRS